MKTIMIFYVIVLFFGCKTDLYNSKQQPTKFIRTTITHINMPQFRSFKAFKNDTIQYLEHNFERRKSYYIDRPLKALLDNLEMSVFQGIISEGQKFKGGCDPSFNDSVAYISLYMDKLGILPKIKQRLKPNILVIELKPFKSDSAWLLNKKYYKTASRWPKEVADYYADKRIKNISTISK